MFVIFLLSFYLLLKKKKSVEIKKDVLFLSSFYSIRMYYVIIYTMSFNGYGNVLTRIYLNELTVKFHRSICQVLCESGGLHVKYSKVIWIFFSQKIGKFIIRKRLLMIKHNVTSKLIKISLVLYQIWYLSLKIIYHQ